MALNTRELFMENPLKSLVGCSPAVRFEQGRRARQLGNQRHHVSDHALMAARAAKPAEARSRLAQVAFGGTAPMTGPKVNGAP